jgi:aryl-alcohol dehydrogenase-like predicted oxidoreductase
MSMVRLGRTGIVVEKNAFGALPIQRVDVNEAVHILRKAYENGFRYFDTARSYSNSEEKIGLALSDVRKDVYIATKTMSKTPEEFWTHLKTSWEMLNTDYIDVFQFHNPGVCFSRRR